MLGPTHAIAGGAFAALAIPPASKALGLDLGPEEVAIGVGIGTLAGVLPDIDHPNAFISKGVIPGWQKLGPVGRGLGWLLSIPPRIIGVGARATMNHRGGTHSLVFLFLWTVLAAPLYSLVALAFAFVGSLILNVLTGVLPGIPTFSVGEVASWLWHATPKAMPLVAISVAAGYFAHLLTDSMTKVPVPWPWPFSKKRYCVLPKFMRITTGSSTEKLLIRPFFGVLLIAALAWNVGVPLSEQLVQEGQKIEQEQTGKKEETKKDSKPSPSDSPASRYNQP